MSQKKNKHFFSLKEVQVAESLKALNRSHLVFLSFSHSIALLALSHSITESSLFLTQLPKGALTCSLFLTRCGLRHRSITLAGPSHFFTHPRRNLR